MIWRVKVNEITFSCLAQNFLKWLHKYIHIIEAFAAGAEVLFVADGGILVRTKGYVELPFAVHPIKAVEAGFVQIYKTRSSLDLA
jgi:hypothetical protein